MGVVKSPSDKREYEVFQLRNGLAALLIHDPEIKLAAERDDGSEEEWEDDEEEEDCEEDEGEDDEEEDEVSSDIEARGSSRKRGGVHQSKKAAAALCVSVGSFSDPKDAEGLAHLLEHMLFMGSSKFPDENEYDGFLAEHGGSSNAFTENEYTVYHFDVNHLHLKPALERFSQFFVAPLFKLDSLEREVQAVDSEFVQSLQNDHCRLNQLRCGTADPLHPYNRFTWGNEKSLTDAIKKCGDIHGKLRNFYRQHYVAGRMKLVVLGGEPLETLKEWVTELFEDVPEGCCEAPSFMWSKPVWPAGKLYRVKSVKDQYSLSLTWPLPYLNNEYLKKPHDYISHLIGHEGSGSLLKFLKLKGWILELSAGVAEDSIERTTAGYLFTVDVKLTEQGSTEVHDIIGHVYQYINMLRVSGPQEWVFEELQAVMAMDFRFAEEENADDYAANLSKNMHLYPSEHVIYGDYSYEYWDPKLVEDVLSCLQPGTMRADLLTKSFDSDAPDVQLEPWFSVHYTVEDIPNDLLELWGKPENQNEAFHMPNVNDFISRDFSIRRSEETKVLPVILCEDPCVKAWYKLDQTFERPKANFYVLITCKMDSVREEVLTQLYFMLLKDALNDTLYMASVASLSSSFYSSTYHVELKIQGYNEKLPVLVSRISEMVKAPAFAEDRFKVMKEHLERGYKNAYLKPLVHSSSLRLELVVEPFWSSSAKLECLSSLQAEDLTNFTSQLFSEAHVEALCHGNLSESEALGLVNIVKDALVTKPLAKPKKRIVKLPLKQGLVYEASVVNAQEENSVAEKYYQIEMDMGIDSIKTRALTDIFEHVVYEPFFDQLRTKEQLGYRVESGSRFTNGIIGFCFRVQSAKYGPDHLHKRIDAFIDRLQGILKSMPEQVFQNYKNSLITEKLEKDNCLSDETDRYWEHVLDQRYVFDEPKRVAKVLGDLKKTDLVAWYRRYIRADGSACRSLCVHIWGCKLGEEMGKNRNKKNHNRKQQQQQQQREIDNITEFKANAEFYPDYNN